jgi:predicted transcriptional regulator
MEPIRERVEIDESLEKLRQGVLAAWMHYQATGLHLTGEEADAWLARLEAGESDGPPACHT